MREGWSDVTLGAACADGGAVQTGPFGSQLHASDYVVSGIPVVMPVNIGDNRIVVTDVARVPTADADRLARHKLRVGDIVYSRRGDIKRRARVREGEAGWLCGTGCLLVRPGPAVDARWLSYWLGTPSVHDWLERHAVGATMPNLNTKILSDLPVDLSPLAEQRRIAAVLGALDDLIETNERLLAGLWEACEVTFGISIQGAPSKPLGEVVDLNYGRALPARSRRSGNALVVSSAGVIGTHDEALVEGPGVVVGRKGTAGSVTWVPADFFPIDTAFYATSDLPALYVYFLLREAKLGDLNTDSAVPGLNRSNALSRFVPVASNAGLQRFRQVATPMREAIGGLDLEVAELKRTRDELLPLLMSGAVSPGEVAVAS